LARKEANCEIRHGEDLSVGLYMPAVGGFMASKAYIKVKQVIVKKLLVTKISQMLMSTCCSWSVQIVK
jgi:hypothetical protein